MCDQRCKRACLVLGPENSGTRLWTRILMACGCYGDGTHMQRIDMQGIPEGEPLLVWRRSLPHAGQWPDLLQMVQRLRDRRFREVQALVCTREWSAVMCSQVANGHVQDAWQAEANLRVAYPYAFDRLRGAGVPYVMGSYEALVQHGEAMLAPLLERLGLASQGDLEELVDQNAKYYQVR